MVASFSIWFSLNHVWFGAVVTVQVLVYILKYRHVHCENTIPRHFSVYHG